VRARRERGWAWVSRAEGEGGWVSVCVRVLGAGRAGWGRAQGAKGANSGDRRTLLDSGWDAGSTQFRNRYNGRFFPV